MQKKHSQSETYVHGYFHNVKGNLLLGIIIVLAMVIIQLLSACDQPEITGETTDIEKKVSLKDVLPEDVKLTSGTSEDVWVKVSILPIGSHSYGLPSNQVTVDNLADNLLVTFGTDKIEIRVKATAGELDDFNLDEVKASVDLKDMEVGSYQIPVTVKLPKGFELLDDVVADVTISEVSNSDTNNE